MRVTNAATIAACTTAGSSTSSRTCRRRGGRSIAASIMRSLDGHGNHERRRALRVEPCHQLLHELERDAILARLVRRVERDEERYRLAGAERVRDVGA